MSRKKIITFLFMLIMAFALVACAANSGNKATETPTPTQNTPTPTKSSTPTPTQAQNANNPESGSSGGNDFGGSENPGGNTGNNNGGTGGTTAVNFDTYSTLPVINVTTATNETGEHLSINSKETYTDCTITLTNCDDAFTIDEAEAGIRLRGNSTSGFAKKPYRIKFSKKQSMLGLNDGAECKSWVLLADWNDYTMSRNYFSLHLASKMTAMEFVPDSTHVEVYIDGQYMGIYLLTEQIQINKNRVALDESGVDDPTITDTGFLLELEASTSRRAAEGVEGEAWFKIDGYATTKTITDAYKVADYTVAYYVIKSDARSEAQVAYIKDYMTQVYNAIYKTKDRETIESLVDIDSAVDMYIIQMLVSDGDGNYSSIYVYKDKGGKLKFGPPWDFDNSYMAGTNGSTFFHLLNDLYKNYDWFSAKVKEKIAEYFSEGGIVSQAWEETVQEIEQNKDAFNNREYPRWRAASLNYSVLGTKYSTIDNALNAFENWLTSHRKWINSTYLK